MKRIVFSAVGGTDPISGQYDGALIHIVRAYRPDLICMYMSREICELSDVDNRYIYCLNKLREIIKADFEVEIIRREDLLDVHIFDTFLIEFETIIADIRKKYDDVELIVNVSSGTPAMKSALQVIAAMSEKRITPIQVSTPAKQINKREDIKGDYQVELQWEMNIDNQEPFENRCQISSNINMAYKLKSEIIKKHIGAYDYIAAAQVASSMTDYLDSNVLKLINAGSSRLKLDNSKCDRLCREAGYDVFPVKSSDEKDIFEYLLLLRIKIIKEEYADFLKGITPIFFELLIRLIEKKLCFKLSDFYVESKTANKTTMRRWNKDAETCGHIPEGVKKTINTNQTIYSWQLIEIIRNITKDEKIIPIVDKIRLVEEKIRNPVAHNITYVTEEVIKQYTDFTSREIFGFIKELAILTGIKVKTENLMSYDSLNREIEKYLEKSIRGERNK